MKLALVLGFAAALAANANPVYVAGACVGVCGTDTGNGDIPNAPSGNAYSFVTTAGGVSQGGVIPVGSPGSETNGSTLTTGLFAAMAGDTLNFNFDYITSDGAGYPDYAWAALLNADGSEAALLFTARTEPSPTPIV
ncbi:MAG: NF038132 family protein, partial [Acidobacteriota bacterium]|nr:NF038132 family protein [Acidobacteriota bacterium]